MIDQPTIDRILDASNIVDVVSEFVTLRKRGVNYVGLCPFHSDKSPSFYVSPSKNICKCFACGEGGTAVHFIMKHEQLSYFDALRVLAKKYNIDIQERELTDAEKQVKNDRESMLIVNSFAQKYFSSMLYEHMEGKNIGLRYFAERGFREDIIRKFQLGYSLEQRDAFFLEATKSGYRKEFLEKTGLVIAYDNGSVADRFRGRVIFPVHTLSGKVVAFGGRVLKKDEKTAKYMNSPESEIYHKSNELYGIYFAKQAIVKADRCFLVEGYTDVISMHQAGIENVVASSGTALTQGQIRLIHRFTNNITVLYDGDAAGIKAALRGIDLLLEEGMNIKVVLLPDGEDPDSFARKQNATQFGEFIKEHETDFIRFKTRLLLDDAGGDPIKRSNLISDIVRTVAIIPDNIARSVYIRECSSMLEIDERVLLNEVNNLKLSKDEKRGGVAPVQDVPVTAIPDYPPLPEYMDEAFPPDAPAFPPEDYRPEEADVQMQQQPVVPPKRVLSSPYEVYEIALLRYVVRYGECVLYDYVDTESGQQVIIKVAQYIKYSLEEDDLSFMNPLFKKMLEAAAEGCATEGFIASRYFLSHSDQVISRLAANLLSDKYHLSKYHTKYRELEEEKDRLEQVVLRDLYGLKDAYIHQRIKDVQTKIKEAQIERNMDKTMELMQELTKLNEIKSVLSKEIGERIILKM
ncbi:MAG: DNA primase [Parabacteroides sp.]|jgi:DNA primase|nr:DNA primase [Parabacteroides sp.]MBP9481080.1 DNA primase [Parabacteroides sp.]MBP9577939.1 DNA primase [Parabacteroides sp.]